MRSRAHGTSRAAALAALAAGASLATGALAEDDARIRSQADLEKYVTAFNEHRYADQIAYYAPDVSYSVGSITLSSPQAIADFYDDFHDYVREHVDIAAFAQTGNVVAVVIPTRFEAFRDYDKNGLAYKAGEVREIVTFAFYELQDGKIRRIRMARYNGSKADFEK